MSGYHTQGVTTSVKKKIVIFPRGVNSEMGCKILSRLPAEIGGDEEWDEDKAKGCYFLWSNMVKKPVIDNCCTLQLQRQGNWGLGG